MATKNSRIEIRIPEEIKQKLQVIANKRNTTMSTIVYTLILNEIIREENNNGKIY